MQPDKSKEPIDLIGQLKGAIESCGMSVYQVAKSAGVKHAVVARFLSGERDLRLETASKIANALRLSLRGQRKADKRKQSTE